MAEESLEHYVGKVQRIYENTTHSGRDYKVFEILTEDRETTRYSVWNDLGIDIQEGDQIQFTWKRSGNYKNLTKLERIEQEQPQIQDQDQRGNAVSGYADRDRIIKRQLESRRQTPFQFSRGNQFGGSTPTDHRHLRSI